MEKTNINALSPEEQSLLKTAKNAAARHINNHGVRYTGAALLCTDGTLYEGASIRRTASSSSTCSERMVIDKALFDGKNNFTSLAIVGFHKTDTLEEITSPCGTCRQIIAETDRYSKNTEPISILLANSDLIEVIKTDSRELLPLSYKGAY